MGLPSRRFTENLYTKQNTALTGHHSVKVFLRSFVYTELLFIAAPKWIETSPEVKTKRHTWLPKANTHPAFDHPGRPCTHYALVFFHSLSPLLLLLYFIPLCPSIKVNALCINLGPPWLQSQNICDRKYWSLPQEKSWSSTSQWVFVWLALWVM